MIHKQMDFQLRGIVHYLVDRDFLRPLQDLLFGPSGKSRDHY